jgi:hypothetical protein
MVYTQSVPFVPFVPVFFIKSPKKMDFLYNLVKNGGTSGTSGTDWKLYFLDII